MKIKQAYISESLEGLDFLSKYSLKNYWSTHEPLVIFGMYRNEDIYIFKNHPAPVNLVFQGSDALNLSSAWAEVIKNRKDCKVYAISHWISDSLFKKGIAHYVVPISATSLDWYNPIPLGDHVYFYSSDDTTDNFEYYGGPIAQEVEKKTGLPFIYATLKTFYKEQLKEAYTKSFINLRLTKYDGCPNGVIEMGLMGRPSVFNGDLPYAFKWNDVDMICDTVEFVYEMRKDFDYFGTANDYKNFLNINLDFLETK